MYDVCTYNRFFENQPNEICSHLSEKASQKAGFLSPRSSKITETKEKERRKRKSEEKEKRRGGKSNGKIALLVFIIATLETTVGRKKVYLAITFSKIPNQLDGLLQLAQLVERCDQYRKWVISID